MPKDKDKKVQYVAQVAVSSDKTNRRFTPGDVVTIVDFPAQVIENWLELGVLVEQEKKDESS